jgi:hypothetical protein
MLIKKKRMGIREIPIQIESREVTFLARLRFAMYTSRPLAGVAAEPDGRLGGSWKAGIPALNVLTI